MDIHPSDSASSKFQAVLASPSHSLMLQLAETTTSFKRQFDIDFPATFSPFLPTFHIRHPPALSPHHPPPSPTIPPCSEAARDPAAVGRSGRRPGPRRPWATARSHGSHGSHGDGWPIGQGKWEKIERRWENIIKYLRRTELRQGSSIASQSF